MVFDWCIVMYSCVNSFIHFKETRFFSISRFSIERIAQGQWLAGGGGAPQQQQEQCIFHGRLNLSLSLQSSKISNIWTGITDGHESYRHLWEKFGTTTQKVYSITKSDNFNVKFLTVSHYKCHLWDNCRTMIKQSSFIRKKIAYFEKVYDLKPLKKLLTIMLCHRHLWVASATTTLAIRTATSGSSQEQNHNSKPLM